MNVAALFVQKNGCYSGDPRIDLWDEDRDARKYNGNLPVVAHPPCQLWGALACVNFKRWGGEHNRPGNDQGCFASALASVRRCGGVIEHPANSKAWTSHGLSAPTTTGWQMTICGGWVCEVWQSAYGHKANKATWIYYFGSNSPKPFNWSRPIGTHQIGGRDYSRSKEMNKPTIRGKEASATPLLFKEALINLAIGSSK